MLVYWVIGKQQPRVALLVITCNGVCLRGFASKLRNMDVDTVEMQSIKMGLSLASEKRFSRIIVETDSTNAFNWIYYKKSHRFSPELSPHQRLCLAK